MDAIFIFHWFKFNFVFIVRRAGWKMRPSILCYLPNCWASDGLWRSWRNWRAEIFCGWWVKWKLFVIKCVKEVFYHTKTYSPIAMMIHTIAQPVKFLSSIQIIPTIAFLRCEKHLTMIPSVTSLSPKVIRIPKFKWKCLKSCTTKNERKNIHI